MRSRRRNTAQRVRSALAICCALACAAVADVANAGLGTAIEFYNRAINHYFVTAYPEEAAALDAGTNVKGWNRTGGQFTVFTDPAPTACRRCAASSARRAWDPTRTSTRPTPPSARR